MTAFASDAADALRTRHRADILGAAAHDDANLLLRYFDACSSDLERLLPILLSAFNLQPGDIEFFCEIDSRNYGLQASVSPLTDNVYYLRLSLGLFLIIDDFTGAVATYHDHHDGPLPRSKVMRVKEEDPDWQFRFVDYRHLPSLTGAQAAKRAPFGGEHSFAHMSEKRILIANTVLLWVLAHEISHVVLGHVDHQRAAGESDAYLEVPVLEMSDAPPEGGPSLYHAREYHADFAATFLVTALLGRSDVLEAVADAGLVRPEIEIWIGLLGEVMCYGAVLFEKSRAYRRLGPSPSHPMPFSRLYNHWVAMEMAQAELLGQLARDLASVQPVYRSINLAPALFNLAQQVAHIELVCDIIDLSFGSNSYFREMGAAGGAFVSMGNDHKFLDTVKFACSVTNHKILLNYFTEAEEPYAYIEEWKATYRFLISGADKEFRKYRRIPRKSFAYQIFDLLQFIFDNLHVAERAVRNDPEAVKHIYIRCLQIAGIMGDIRKELLERE